MIRLLWAATVSAGNPAMTFWEYLVDTPVMAAATILPPATVIRTDTPPCRLDPLPEYDPSFSSEAENAFVGCGGGMGAGVRRTAIAVAAAEAGVAGLTVADGGGGVGGAAIGWEVVVNVVVVGLTAVSGTPDAPSAVPAAIAVAASWVTP